MFFPEELDNRSLRLLVERTLSRRTQQKPLSTLEQTISDIIAEFPELGFQNNEPLDVYATFDDNEQNPFLWLSAIWEVRKQLEADSPKGIRKIVFDYFRASSLKPDDLLRVAETYLALYLQQEERDAPLSEKEYLWDIYFALNQSENPADEKPDSDAVPPGLIGDAFSAIARELHDEASFIKLNSHMSAIEMYYQLPIEWINAMSNYWQRPEHQLKRDNVGEIVAYLTSKECLAELPNKLSREEKACLSYIIQRNNQVGYAEASKEFGPEHNDGYWWTHDVPKSTLGNVRMMGLVVVGEVHDEDVARRIAMIPTEILPAVKKSI